MVVLYQKKSVFKYETIYSKNTLNFIQDGVEGRRRGQGGQQNDPTSFSTATSPKAGKTPKKVLNLRFTPFATVIKKFQGCTLHQPQLNTIPQKYWCTWSNPYQTEFMITSLTVMLQLPNFGHMNKSTIKFHCRSKTLSITSFAKGTAL